MSERRFTDHDVARILQRASELDERSATVSPVRGLSLRELEEIADEVGIDPAMISRAAAELNHMTRRTPRGLLGHHPTNRQTRIVEEALDREALAALLSVVDERVPAQGNVGEALGSARWSASDWALSRQVVLRPSGEETLIRVEERWSDAVRGALHGVPAAYGAMIGLAVGLEGIGGVAPGLSLAAVAGAAGFGLGRGLWNVLWRRSRRRVEALANALAAEAKKLVRPLGP